MMLTTATLVIVSNLLGTDNEYEIINIVGLCHSVMAILVPTTVIYINTVLSN